MDHENPFLTALAPGQSGRSSCVGRQGVVDSIRFLVGGPTPVVVNLVGPRWIGKTTVLHCLRGEGCGAGGEVDNLLCVYVDLKSEAGQRNPFALVAQGIYAALAARRDVNLNAGLRDLDAGLAGTMNQPALEKALARLAEVAGLAGVRLVVCIDHLDKAMATDANIDLRTLGPLTGSASLIIATRQTLTDIRPDLAASPFVLNSFIYSLSLLEREAALELLVECGAGREPKLSLRDMEELIKYVGRHPLILSRAGYRAYDWLLETPERRDLTVNDIRTLIEPSLRPLFEGLWQEYGPILQRYEALRRNGLGSLSRGEQRAIRQELQRAALIYEDSETPDSYKYFSPLFKSFVIQKTKPLVPAKEVAVPGQMNLAEVAEVLDVRPGTKEHELLGLLIERAGTPIADPQLQSAVWGGEADRAMVTTVSRLRSKLEQHRRRVNGQIVRSRGKGYAFQWLPPGR